LVLGVAVFLYFEFDGCILFQQVTMTGEALKALYEQGCITVIRFGHSLPLHFFGGLLALDY
jgi:hypothetical protein